MTKFIGGFMIAMVCAWFGFRSADGLKRRHEYLKQFISSLCALETEITFAGYELKTIFQHNAKNDLLHDFYILCADRIEADGIKSAWRSSLHDIKDNACLKADDIAVMEQLGNELGMSDINGQKKAIERTCELLKSNEQSSYEEYARLAKVYRSCGVLAGIFVIIAIM